MASLKLDGLAGRKIEGEHTHRTYQGRPTEAQSVVHTGLFIDNQFVPAYDGSTLALENPSNGMHLGAISAAQRQDVDKAVASAKNTFQTI